MKDILETLQALQNTPVPNLLVIAGFILLFLAFVGRFGAFVELPKGRQKWAGIIGALLLIFGISLFIAPSDTIPPDTASVTPDTPTATPVLPTNTPVEKPADTPTATPVLPTNTPVEKPADTPTPEPPTNTPAIESPDTPTPTTVPTSPEQAIRDYYSLIEQKQYAVAWEMSDEYCTGKGISFDIYISEWEKSGPATVVEPIDIVEINDKATITLTLYYPKKGVYHRIRYELVRDVERGNQRFGYWLFAKGTVLY